MISQLLFSIRSWCLSVIDVVSSWRPCSSDPTIDGKGVDSDHGNASKHGPSHRLGTQGILECNSTTGTLEIPRRQVPTDDVRRTGSSSTLPGSFLGTPTQTYMMKSHHRPKRQRLSKMFTILCHWTPPGEISTIGSPQSNSSPNSNHSEDRTGTLADLTNQLTRTSEYAASFGGLSDIWKCDLRRGGSIVAVAVKSIRSQITNAEEAKKKNRRLRRELKVWSGLEHKNIAPLYGTASGFGPYAALVCPWYEKGSLSCYLESVGETLSLVDRFQLLSGVSAGLQYLHYCSIVHGDLTGSNVLISSDGTAHLCDFGLSVVVADLMATSYFTSAFSGTVRWIAPELLAEPDESTNFVPTISSDIYSFGCIMFQVLTGQPPYFEYRRDAQVVVAIMLGKKPSRPTLPAIVDHHWDFILKCWSIEDCRPSAPEVDAYINGQLHMLQHGSPSPE